MTEDEMVGWHHQLNGHEFEQAPGDEGQESLVCCCPWNCKELDVTERLNIAACVLSIFRIACACFSITNFSCIYLNTERENVRTFKYVCKGSIPSSYPFVTNTHGFSNEEIKCFLWRKGWSFILIVQRMTQPATHSDLQAIKCCIVPMLTSMWSS